MRWFLSFAIVIAGASTLDAHPGHGHGGGGHSGGYSGGHFHGGGFSSFGVGGFGLGGLYGGYRNYGFNPGYGGIGGYGYSPFGAARLGVYNTYYQSFGLSGLNYYRGPVGGYIAPPVYGYPGVGAGYYAPLYFNPGYSAPIVQPPTNQWPAPILGGGPIPPQVPQLDPNNPALFDERGIPGPQGLDQQIVRDEPLEGVEPAVRVSNVEAKTRSIRFNAAGDEWFAKRNYMQAYTRYKQSASAAPDLAESRMRMAMALCAMNQPASAAKEIKRALRLDPTVVIKSASLDEVYGDDPSGQIVLNNMLQTLADWVREDIRDPDRLLVMGTILFLHNDPDQALPFLKSSALLTGTDVYLRPFVKQAQRPAPAVVAGPRVAAPPPLAAKPRPAPVLPRAEAPPADVESVNPAIENVQPNEADLGPLKAPDGGEKRVGPRLPDGRFGDEF